MKSTDGSVSLFARNFSPFSTKQKCFFITISRCDNSISGRTKFFTCSENIRLGAQLSKINLPESDNFSTCVGGGGGGTKEKLIFCSNTAGKIRVGSPQKNNASRAREKQKQAGLHGQQNTNIKLLGTCLKLIGKATLPLPHRICGLRAF